MASGTPGGYTQAWPTSQGLRTPNHGGGGAGPWRLYGMEAVGSQGCLGTARPSEALAVLGLRCGVLWP